MGSGYIRISFVGLLAGCDEDVAPHIEARRVNVINFKDQKKTSGNFFWKIFLGVGGHTKFGDAYFVAIALGQAHGSGES